MNAAPRSAPVLVVLAAAVAIGGCGGSSHSSASAAAPTPSSTTTAPAPTSSSTSSTTKPPASRHTKKHRARAPTATTTTTTATATATVRTAPPAVPIGTPAAPSGLAPATGYSTYELCSAQCGGEAPASLRRPLHLPRPAPGGGCAVSAGAGPVRPLGSLRLAATPFIGSSWKAARVTWVASPSYTGPVLIRGRRLGGAGAVGFGEGRTPYDELQLLAPGSDAPPVPGGGRVWLSFTRVRGPGCFAYQVDGTTFSNAIVFEVVG